MKNTTVPNVRGSNEDIKSIEAAAFTVALVLTLSFNSLVLATFYRGRNRREKNVNLFVINLMVCQEMIALLIMPFVVASTMSSVWMTNEVLCQVRVSLTVFIAHCSKV